MRERRIDYRVVPIGEQHIEGFHAAVDVVARERKYLTFLEAPALDESAEFVRDNIERSVPQFVALVGEMVVGWCDVVPLVRPVLAHAGVLGMGLISDYRGAGIGTALIRETLKAARSRGLTRVELTVREGNSRAIALYRKMGFVEEGLKRNAVRIGNVYENHLCMALLFDEVKPDL